MPYYRVQALFMAGVVQVKELGDSNSFQIMGVEVTVQQTLAAL